MSQELEPQPEAFEPKESFWQQFGLPLGMAGVVVTILAVVLLKRQAQPQPLLPPPNLKVTPQTIQESNLNNPHLLAKTDKPKEATETNPNEAKPSIPLAKPQEDPKAKENPKVPSDAQINSLPPLPNISGSLPPMSPGVITSADANSMIKLENDVRKLASDYDARIPTVTNAGKGRRVLTLVVDESKASSLVSKMRNLVGPLGNISEPYDSDSDNAVATQSKKKLNDLRVERAKLLVDFYPDAPVIKDLDRQISTQEQVVMTSPRSQRISVTLGN